MDKSFLRKILEAVAVIAVICLVLGGALIAGRRLLGIGPEVPQNEPASENEDMAFWEAGSEEGSAEAEAPEDGEVYTDEPYTEEVYTDEPYTEEADPEEEEAGEEEAEEEAGPVEADTAAETVYLKDYEDVGSGSYARRLRTLDRVQDNYGNFYDNAISGMKSAEWSANEYRVFGKYRYFTGRVVLDEGMRNWSSEAGQEWVSMKVYGDGKFLYESKVLEKGILPQDFKIEIGDVDILSVEIEGKNCLRLVDAVLTNEENTADWSTMETYAAYLERVDYIPLSELYYLDSSHSTTAFKVYDSFTDADGNTYTDAVGGANFQEDNWLLYDLSGAFSRISGRIVYNPEAGGYVSDVTRVIIYGDGELLYESKLVNPDVDPQDFYLNITGVKQLRVIINGSNHIRIVDCGVSK